MTISLRDKLGALQERDFRLLFSGTLITTIGDGLAGIAIAFAVLDIDSATDLVFSARRSAARSSSPAAPAWRSESMQ